MDIGIKCDEGTFKLRSCGVIYKNGKILVDRARNFDGYVFMGGHVELGETSKKAIVREVKEEVGVNVEIEKLICINENIYPLPNSNLCAHELAYYYLLQPKSALPESDFEYTEIDNNKEVTHKYSWIDLSDVRKENVRPCWIANMLLENKENYYYLTDQTEDC